MARSNTATVQGHMPRRRRPNMIASQAESQTKEELVDHDIGEPTIGSEVDGEEEEADTSGLDALNRGALDRRSPEQISNTTPSSSRPEGLMGSLRNLLRLGPTPFKDKLPVTVVAELPARGPSTSVPKSSSAAKLSASSSNNQAKSKLKRPSRLDRDVSADNEQASSSAGRPDPYSTIGEEHELSGTDRAATSTVEETRSQHKDAGVDNANARRTKRLAGSEVVPHGEGQEEAAPMLRASAAVLTTQRTTKRKAENQFGEPFLQPQAKRRGRVEKNGQSDVNGKASTADSVPKYTRQTRGSRQKAADADVPTSPLQPPMSLPQYTRNRRRQPSVHQEQEPDSSLAREGVATAFALIQGTGVTGAAVEARDLAVQDEDATAEEIAEVDGTQSSTTLKPGRNDHKVLLTDKSAADSAARRARHRAPSRTAGNSTSVGRRTQRVNSKLDILEDVYDRISSDERESSQSGSDEGEVEERTVGIEAWNTQHASAGKSTELRRHVKDMVEEMRKVGKQVGRGSTALADGPTLRLKSRSSIGKELVKILHNMIDVMKAQPKASAEDHVEEFDDAVKNTIKSNVKVMQEKWKSKIMKYDIGTIAAPEKERITVLLSDLYGCVFPSCVEVLHCLWIRYEENQDPCLWDLRMASRIATQLKKMCDFSSTVSTSLQPKAQASATANSGTFQLRQPTRSMQPSLRSFLHSLSELLERQKEEARLEELEAHRQKNFEEHCEKERAAEAQLEAERLEKSQAYYNLQVETINARRRHDQEEHLKREERIWHNFQQSRQPKVRRESSKSTTAEQNVRESAVESTSGRAWSGTHRDGLANAQRLMNVDVGTGHFPVAESDDDTGYAAEERLSIFGNHNINKGARTQEWAAEEGEVFCRLLEENTGIDRYAILQKRLGRTIEIMYETAKQVKINLYAYHEKKNAQRRAQGKKPRAMPAWVASIGEEGRFEA